MTLLRRAPREVYRVYAEDDFFASPAIDEGFRVAGSGTERRLLRLLGGAMLLAVVGAVGALIAITSASPASRAGRRLGSGLLAAAGSLGSSRRAGAHVWRQQAGAGASRSTGTSIRHRTAALAPRRAGIPPRAAAFRGSGSATVEVTSPPASEPVEVATRTPGGSPPGRPLGQSEFGFERAGAQ